MRCFLLLVLLMVANLQSNDFINPYLTSEQNTLSILDGMVNTENGKLVQIDHDILIKGSAPLDVTRYYDSGHHFFGEFGYGVGLSLPVKIEFDPTRGSTNFIIYDRVGSYLHASLGKAHPKNKNDKTYHGHFPDTLYKRGYTNYCEGLLRGEPSVKGTYFLGDDTQFTVGLGDGTDRHYVPYAFEGEVFLYRLVREDRPNGLRRHFTYADKDYPIVKRMWITNSDDSLTLSSMDFEYNNEGKEVKIRASNGQEVTYTKEKRKKTVKNKLKGLETKVTAYLLNKVSGTGLIDVFYDYKNSAHDADRLFSLDQVLRPDGRVIDVEYDSKTRVKNLYIAGQKQYSFRYERNQTEVRDANGHERTYSFSEKRLHEYSDPNHKLTYDWDDDGQLKVLTQLDPSGKIVVERRYQYDDKGFITKVSIKSPIKELGKSDEYIVDYEYSSGRRHELVKETHNGRKTYLYEYKPNTNLRTVKTTLFDGVVVETEYTEYDANAIEIAKIVDDGQCRKITEIEPILDPGSKSMTLPKVIREGYITADGHKIWTKTIERTYTQGDLVQEERVYDQLGNFAYKTQAEYNKKRLKVKEVNALGEITLFDYDKNHNKAFEKNLQTGKEVYFTYDARNKLISEEERFADGSKRRTSHTYDAMGNRLSTTDPFGQTTYYTCDSEGRVTSITNPLGGVERKEYDPQGRITKQIDCCGAVTQKIYNLNAEPLQIIYPDRTEKRFTYDIFGYLIKEVERDGTYSEYEVDYMGRPLVKREFSSKGLMIRETKKVYRGQQLIREIDPCGVETLFEYDEAGRKISEITEGRISCFSYDTLGRECIKQKGDAVACKVYDALDRVIEERIEDSQGKLYQKTRYLYDAHGNKQETLSYSDEVSFVSEHKVYDAQNRLSFEKDPSGNTTFYRYRETDHLEKETIDPLGRLSLEIHDALGRITETIEKDASGQVIGRARFSYDPMGRKTLHQETLYYEGAAIGTYSVTFVYDIMGQKLSETEQNERIVSYIYEKGRLKIIRKPDGVELYHTYDALGRLKTLSSSDRTIDYRYHYDLKDNVILIEDLLSDTKLERAYDAFGNLISEKLPTGLESSYTYDFADRILSATHGERSLYYTYSPTTLIGAVYVKEGEAPVAWNRSCNLRQLPLETKIAAIESTFDWDKNGRLLALNTEGYNRKYLFDSVGNLTQEFQSDSLINTYIYDDLDQLIEEKGESNASYAYDSIHNRRRKDELTYTLDALNQVIQGTSSYRYDLNGRRINQDECIYRYDALGRLVSLNDIHYTYDPLGRRMTRTQNGHTTCYRYQFNTEIGDKSNFKALYGRTAPFVIELENTLYVPTQNYRGDIVQLSYLNGDIAAVNTFDAYGNSTVNGVTSPWLFCGARLDTGLYHFEKREYDPVLGRWLTPDPLGMQDGPNLYAYVHNRPLCFTDPYGLFAFDFGGIAEGTFRAALDHSSFGISNFLLGEYKPSSLQAQYAYKAADIGLTALSLACPIKALATQAIRTTSKVVQGGYRAAKVLKAEVNIQNVAKQTLGFSKSSPSSSVAVAKSGKTVDFVGNVNAVSYGKVVGEGTVHVKPTIKAIEKGTLRHRGLYENAEMHSELLGKEFGYWKEYHLLEHGSRSPLRILRGSQGEYYFSPDHYISILPLN